MAEVVEEEEEEEVLQHPVDVDDLLLAYPLSHCHLLATLVASHSQTKRDRHHNTIIHIKTRTSGNGLWHSSAPVPANR